MTEDIPKSASKGKGRMSLFVPALKRPYDLRDAYPDDYKDKVENELEQWKELLSTADAQVKSLAECLNKGDSKTVKIDANSIMGNDKDFEGIFDHSLYYDYLDSVNKFCKKVTCAIEQCALEKEKRDKKLEILSRKSELVHRSIKGDIKKYF